MLEMILLRAIIIATLLSNQLNNQDYKQTLKWGSNQSKTNKHNLILETSQRMVLLNQLLKGCSKQFKLPVQIWTQINTFATMSRKWKLAITMLN